MTIDHDCTLTKTPWEIKLCLSWLFREAANEEGGINEHKQAQPGRAREEDRDEADERREEQLEQGRATSGGRQLKKLNISQSVSFNAESIWRYSARSTAKVVLKIMKESKNLNSWRLCYWAFLWFQFRSCSTVQ